MPTPLHADPGTIIKGAQMLAEQQQAGGGHNQEPGVRGTPADGTGRFVASILGETEDVWSAVLPRQMRLAYEEPRLVMFKGATHSACGFAKSAMGPFYCPRDRTVRISHAGLACQVS